jgi:hypothetical protein
MRAAVRPSSGRATLNAATGRAACHADGEPCCGSACIPLPTYLDVELIIDGLTFTECADPGSTLPPGCDGGTFPDKERTLYQIGGLTARIQMISTPSGDGGWIASGMGQPGIEVNLTTYQWDDVNSVFIASGPTPTALGLQASIAHGIPRAGYSGLWTRIIVNFDDWEGKIGTGTTWMPCNDFPLGGAVLVESEKDAATPGLTCASLEVSCGGTTWRRRFGHIDVWGASANVTFSASTAADRYLFVHNDVDGVLLVDGPIDSARPSYDTGWINIGQSASVGNRWRIIHTAPGAGEPTPTYP